MEGEVGEETRQRGRKRNCDQYIKTKNKIPKQRHQDVNVYEFYNYKNWYVTKEFCSR